DDIGWGLDRLLDGLAAIIEPLDADATDETTTDSVPASSPDQERATADALAVARAYASDPKVKKAAGKRKEAEKKVREAQKRVRELEKAAREALRAEAEAARAAAGRGT